MDSLVLSGSECAGPGLLGKGEGGCAWLAEREGTLCYVDCECNPYMDQWSFENWGVRYWSRTPELDAYAREHGDLERSRSWNRENTPY